VKPVKAAGVELLMQQRQERQLEKTASYDVSHWVNQMIRIGGYYTGREKATQDCPSYTREPFLHVICGLLVEVQLM
jgi:hypothetical protein